MKNTMKIYSFFLLLTAFLGCVDNCDTSLSEQTKKEFKEIQAICEQYIENNIATTEYNGTAFCSCELMGIDNNNIYLWIYCEEYYLKDNLLEKGSGLFEPISLEMDKNNKVINYSLPREGMGYTNDLKIIFPKCIIESEDLIGNPSEEFTKKYYERGKSLGEKNLSKAKIYYKLNQK
ncbi:MAG: hypothetical protein KAT68_14060 [Bacteroidales bacterium]|nr:hypothetical protein [Bacteroidales bacterium]